VPDSNIGGRASGVNPSKALLDDIEWLRIEFRNRLFEGIIVKDVETDTILFVNEACADYVGATVDAMIGSHSSEFFPEHYREYHADDVEIVRSWTEKCNYLEQYVARNGRVHQIMTTKWPVKIEGRDCVCLTFFDMTAALNAVDKSQHYGRAYRSETLESSRKEAQRLLGALYG